jgi:hypothetical protein
MNPGTLTGNTGIPGPTLADFSAKVNKSTTTLLALIMMPTVGLHTGVTGTDAAANKIDDIKVCSPERKNEYSPNGL